MWTAILPIGHASVWWRLQSGESESTGCGAVGDQSRTYFQDIYQRLDITLSSKMIVARVSTTRCFRRGGRFEEGGLLQSSQGADVVFPPGFKDRDGNDQAMIVRKSDGGYLYATTDLAAARYRVDQLEAERIIYVTDARQSQHFAMVFTTLQQAGWVSESVRLEHVPFGTVLGKDNKPFKTREGGTVKLVSLIDEAQKTSRGDHSTKERRSGRSRKSKDCSRGRDRCFEVRRSVQRSNQRLRV